MKRGEGGLAGGCLPACITGVSRFSRFYVGWSVQVLESRIRASADHGSISRAGLSFSPRRR